MNCKNKNSININFNYRISNRKLRKNKRVSEYSKQNLKDSIPSQEPKIKWSCSYQHTIFKKIVKSNNPNLLNDYLGYFDCPKVSFIRLKEFIFRFDEDMKIPKVEMIRDELDPFLKFKSSSRGHYF